MTSQQIALYTELERLADADAPLEELELALQGQRPRLGRNEYDELWLYSWALVRRQPPALMSGLTRTWDSYDG
jgi:hypothetical protein